MSRRLLKDWVWMPHAGHFICGSRCQFRLNTYVNGYIVSTVGEMPETPPNPDGKWHEIGWDRTYETMVFRAKKSKHICCPYEMREPGELDSNGYNTADKATTGHMKMCLKYERLGKGGEDDRRESA